MRSYTMDLGESPHANSAPVAASTTAPVSGESAVPVPRATVPPAKSPGAAIVAPPASTEPLATTPRPKSGKPPAATATVWTVQLGTFTNRENAARLDSRLKAHGFSATLSEATRNGHKLYRVRVGAERERAAAQKLLGRLKAAGEKGAEIVSR
jgi:DedD protein